MASSTAAVVGHFLDPRHIRPFLLNLLHARERHLFLGGSLHGFVEQVPDDLVADGRNADLQALANALDDHPGSGVRLSGSWWALDREDGAIETEDRSLRELEAGFAITPLMAALSQARAVCEEKLPGCALLGPIDAFGDDVVREAHEGARDDVRPYVGMYECRVRMLVSPVQPLLHLDPALAEVDVDDGPERLPVVGEQLVVLRALRTPAAGTCSGRPGTSRGPSEAFA